MSVSQTILSMIQAREALEKGAVSGLSAYIDKSLMSHYGHSSITTPFLVVEMWPDDTVQISGFKVPTIDASVLQKLVHKAWDDEPEPKPWTNPNFNPRGFVAKPGSVVRILKP